MCQWRKQSLCCGALVMCHVSGGHVRKLLVLADGFVTIGEGMFHRVRYGLFSQDWMCIFFWLPIKKTTYLLDFYWSVFRSVKTKLLYLTPKPNKTTNHLVSLFSYSLPLVKDNSKCKSTSSLTHLINIYFLVSWTIHVWSIYLSHMCICLSVSVMTLIHEDLLQSCAEVKIDQLR